MGFLKPDMYYEGKPAYWIPDHEWLQRSLLMLFAMSIADFEGFYIPDSISQQHNNPGNLRPVGASTGFQTFATPTEGWKALIGQIKLNIKRGLTLEEFFLGKEGVYPGYAPLGDNDAEVMDNYIAFVRHKTGFGRGIPLTTYFPYLLSSKPQGGIFYVYNGF